MKGLIGREYKSLVNDLESRLDDIVEGKDVPRVVILEAPSGSGKSRVIRELYERLRANPKYRNETHLGECYWPALESDVYIEDGLHSGFQHRKELGPSHASFFRPPHALPGFMWQTIRCDLLAGKVKGSALEIIGPQIQAHLPYLAHAIHAHKSPKEKAKSAFDRIFNLGEWEKIKDASIGEGVLKVFEKLEILQGVPFVSWGIDRGIEAFRVAREQISRRKDVASGGDLGAALTSAESIYRNLISGVHKKIPLILAIEDIHLIDDEVAALISGLAEPIKGKPVLVIGTAWPESQSRDAYLALLQSLGSKGGPGDVRLEVISENETGRKFPTLSPKEKSKFVTYYAPKTQIATAVEVASLFENPFAIKLSMSSRLVQNLISDQGLKISKKHLIKLPKTVEEIYRSRWKEIAAPVREVLISATATFPQSELSSGELHFFMRDILIEALVTWNGTKHKMETTSNALAKATDPLRWIKEVDSNSIAVFQFKEWVLQRVASEELSEQWNSEEINAFRQVTVEVLQKKILKSFDEVPKANPKFFSANDVAGQRAARYFLGLIAGSPNIKFSFEAEQICRLTLGYAASQKDKTQESLAHLSKFRFTETNLKNDFMWEVKYEYDRAISELWPSPRILENLKRDLRKLEKYDASHRWPHLGYRTLIARTELELRKPERALESWRSIAPQVVRDFGAKHIFFLKLLGNMMEVYISLGDIRNARRTLQRIAKIVNAAGEELSAYRSVVNEKDWELNGNVDSYFAAIDEMTNEVELARAKFGSEATTTIIARNDVIVFKNEKVEPTLEIAELRELIESAEHSSEQNHEYFGHLLLHNLSLALHREFWTSSYNPDGLLKSDFAKVSSEAFEFAKRHQNRYTKNFSIALSTRIEQLVNLGEFTEAKHLLRLEETLLAGVEDRGQSQRRHLINQATFLGTMGESSPDKLNLIAEARSILVALFRDFREQRERARNIARDIVYYSAKLNDPTAQLYWGKVAINLAKPEVEPNGYFSDVTFRIRVLIERAKRKQVISQISDGLIVANLLANHHPIPVLDFYRSCIGFYLHLDEYKLAFQASNLVRDLLAKVDSKVFSGISVANAWQLCFQASTEFGDLTSVEEDSRQVSLAIKRAKSGFSVEDFKRAEFNLICSKRNHTTLNKRRTEIQKIVKEIGALSTRGQWWAEWAKFVAADSEITNSARLKAFEEVIPSTELDVTSTVYFNAIKCLFVARESRILGMEHAAITKLQHQIEITSDADASVRLLTELAFQQTIAGQFTLARRTLGMAQREFAACNRPKHPAKWGIITYKIFLQMRSENLAHGISRIRDLRAQLETEFHKDSALVYSTFEVEFLAMAMSGKKARAEAILNRILERFDERTFDHLQREYLNKFL